MKTCSQCQQELPLEAFNVQSTGKLGRRADCKGCIKRFIRSKRGLVKEAHGQQRATAKRRGYAAPSYTEAELLAWAMLDPEFHEVFAAWEESGYLTNFKPSFDRKNDYISYTLDNLQIVTWSENNTKGKAWQIDGTNTKTSLAVDMLDLDSNFLKRFHSVSAAARQFKGIPSNITGAINNRVTVRIEPDGSERSYTKAVAYGHKWRYSTLPNLNLEIT